MFLMFVLVFLVVYSFTYIFIGSSTLGVIFGVVFSAVYIAVTYYFATDIVLNISHAKPVTREDYPYLYQITEGLAIASGIPMPKIYMINEDSLNAFAAGKNPDNSVIVVTRGLVENLNRRELSGVIAHEMSHIANYDVRFAVLAVVMVGLIALIASTFRYSLFLGGGRDRKAGPLAVIALFFLILSPLFAQLVRMAISRQREYMADANGARLTRDPQGLISALEKVSQSKPVKAANDATASLYFANPLKGNDFSEFFATHPKIEKRVERLKKL
ncbi:M48 family metalloprotease [Candidatus Micrarchaeota archaeon]|nr:M48 family metalloprotease [Candidatus Micrarchaeota archaeon]